MNLPNTSASAFQMDEACGISSSVGATIGKVLAYIFIFFMSAVGNIIVIGVVLRTKRPRGVMDIFIVNMAFSDLFVPFLMIPKELFEIISGSLEWQVSGLVGNVLCKSYFFIADISPIVSVLTLCCITVERFLAVTRPKLPSYKESKLHLIIVALTWIIAMGYCAPYMYIYKLEWTGSPSEGTNGTATLSCGINWEPAFDHVATHRAYVAAACVLFVIIPFFSMTFMYTYLVFKVRTSYKLMANSLSPRAKRRRALKMWTLLKLSIAVVLGFTICWAPFNVGIFLLVFVWHWQPPMSCFFDTYWFVAIMMSSLNAGVNPWIYLVFVERFKKHLQEIRKTFSSLLSLRSLSPAQPQSPEPEKKEGEEKAKKVRCKSSC